MWLIQWPIRALILLLVSRLPLGVEMASFPIALLSAVVIGLLGTLLVWPLKFLLARAGRSPHWGVCSVRSPSCSTG